MLREKLYERRRWRGVIHTTWNPDGPGVIRLHMIPPRFHWFRTVPSLVIINGQDIVPLNEGWAILLTELIEGINKHGDAPISQEQMEEILQEVFREVRKVYGKVSDDLLREDLRTIVDAFEAIARGRKPDIDIGILSLADYAPEMTAPHRMDLMISAMTKEGSWHCNQRCLHCYAAGQEYAEVPELTTDQWKTIIAKCREARIPQLTFTGGEPTLREDLCELIYEARWFVTRLNTNGVLLTEELCRSLRKAELDSVQVTLYSHKAEIHNRLVGADNFEQTVQGIRSALAAGLNLSVNTPLCSLNRDYAGMLAFLHELGVQYVTCSGLIVTGGARTAASQETQLAPEEIYEAVRAATEFAYSHEMEISFTSPGWIESERLTALGLTVPSCGACLSNMAVTPDGHVIPCQSWLSEQPLGSILTDTWPAIWDSAACRTIREQSVREQGVCPLRAADREGGEA
ncbi:MAG: radical SAM protein [Mogibacterium sp.]|nr:radical SAM protein [Mogibacterium sp.]